MNTRLFLEFSPPHGSRKFLDREELIPGLLQYVKSYFRERRLAPAELAVAILIPTFDFRRGQFRDRQLAVLVRVGP